ncbi:hypothetical protein LEP1GSC035_3069 [Leptospira noguchii str. 2007001578]|uniref:Uncharacterized protein n=1 Tax=Leptospira noguchii str. 2007001578 TaxID=1049974 RepID=A0ABN0J6P4_9LEPT|nr:hypothetical protein LEP1GSC035_3069 [Leptospira noguchii str. 2007001578]
MLHPIIFLGKHWNISNDFFIQYQIKNSLNIKFDVRKLGQIRLAIGKPDRALCSGK